jgi:hypothetical protein
MRNGRAGTGAAPQRPPAGRLGRVVQGQASNRSVSAYGTRQRRLIGLLVFQENRCLHLPRRE